MHQNANKLVHEDMQISSKFLTLKIMNHAAAEMLKFTWFLLFFSSW